MAARARSRSAGSAGCSASGARSTPTRCARACGTATLDAVLFPKDPVANAGRLIAALRTVFPPTRDRHVAGPMRAPRLGRADARHRRARARLRVGRRARAGRSWGSCTRPSRAEGSRRSSSRSTSTRSGIWDRDRGDFSLDATLYDSHIALRQAVRATRRCGMKSGDDSFFLFSIGGYHPEFAAPASFPKLERLKISARGLGEPPADPHRLPRAHVEHAAGRRRDRLLRRLGGSRSRPAQLRRAL